MFRCFGVAAVLLSGSAAAQEGDIAFWTVDGVSAEEERDLRADVERRMGFRLVDRSDARALLPRPDAVDVRTRVARAEAAYSQLRFDEGRALYNRLIDETLESSLRVADPANLATLIAARAAVELGDGNSEAARRDASLAVRLNHNVVLSSSTFGPTSARLLVDARRANQGLRTAPLEVVLSPTESTARLDGVVLDGRTPTPASVGTHLLTVERPGYAARSQWVAIGEGGLVLRVELPLLEGSALRAQAAVLLEQDPQEVLDRVASLAVGRALGARHVIEADCVQQGIRLRVIRVADGFVRSETWNDGALADSTVPENAPGVLDPIPERRTTDGEGDDPWYSHWLVWTAIGAIVIGGIVAGVLIATSDSEFTLMIDAPR